MLTPKAQVEDSGNALFKSKTLLRLRAEKAAPASDLRDDHP
jgi:hypothetical protein